MTIRDILPFAHQLLSETLNEGGFAVDATAGNGHDTVFLAQQVGKTGHVYAFDIQADAIANTKERLMQYALDDRVTLLQTGHEHVQTTIPDTAHGHIQAAIFNLGYLPGGDKAIVTTHQTTIAAIDQLLQVIAPGGVIVLVIYHGHPEGEHERDHVLTYVSNLPQEKVHVLRYEFMNRKNNAPFIVALEKR